MNSVQYTKQRSIMDLKIFARTVEDAYRKHVMDLAHQEAFKDANEIIELVKDTVDIVSIIKPIYNFKHSES